MPAFLFFRRIDFFRSVKGIAFVANDVGAGHVGGLHLGHNFVYFSVDCISECLGVGDLFLVLGELYCVICVFV